MPAPTLEPGWDQCQWDGSFGRCLLRATIDRRWCGWHFVCRRMGYHGGDLAEFEKWATSKPDSSEWRRWPVLDLFDLSQGKFVQIASGTTSTEEQQRTVPPHEAKKEAQAARRELERTKEIPF